MLTITVVSAHERICRIQEKSFQGKNELKKNQHFELLGKEKTELEEKNTNLGVRYNLKFIKVRYVIQLRIGCTMLHIFV